MASGDVDVDAVTSHPTYVDLPYALIGHSI